MLLLSTLLMSNRCHDPLWDNDSSYKSNREGIPESQYLTTLPEKAFQSKVVGTGWRLQNIRVIKPGTYELEDVSAIVSSKITPHSLYFSNDSVTVFFVSTYQKSAVGKALHLFSTRKHCKNRCTTLSANRTGKQLSHHRRISVYRQQRTKGVRATELRTHERL